MTSSKKSAEIAGRLVQDANRDFTENTNTPGVFEAGLAGQTVQLLNAHGRVIATTTTDSHGGYRFTKLAEGDYVVRVPTAVNGQTLAPKDVGSPNEDSDANPNGLTDRIHLDKGERQLQIDFVYGRYSDGVVDGEEFGEDMGVGYDDANPPTDGGGDRITNNADVILGNGGDDTIRAGGGDDTVFGGTGNDVIDAGAGDDSVTGGQGADVIVGGSGNDTLIGDDLSVGPNLIVNGSFEDTTGMTATGYGFVTNTGVIPGWSDTSGNAIDVHNDNRDGQVATDGRNWLDLEASPGNNRVGQNVAGVEDGLSYRLSFDVSDSPHLTATDGPNENIVKVFWGGQMVATIDPSNVGESDFQTVTLDLVGGAGDGSNRLEFLGLGREDKFGAAIDNVSLVQLSAATGPGGNDTIEGGDGDDLILGQGGNDVLSGGAGHDSLTGDAGRDKMDGGTGNDTLRGGYGNDTIAGGTGNDLIEGGGGAAPGPVVTVTRESFNWEAVSEGQADSTVAQVTGKVTVTYSRTADTGAHYSGISGDALNVAGIDGGGETVDTDTSLGSFTDGKGNIGAFKWTFSQPVDNLQFNINDLDGDGLVTFRAFDAAGNPIPVSLQGGAAIALVNTDGVPGADTGDAIGPYVDTDDPAATVQVTIAGPVARLEVVHTQNGGNNSGIRITDLFFDVTTTTEPVADTDADLLSGDDGNDTIFGNAGDDTITGGSGDRISGGADADSIVIDAAARDASGGRATGIFVDGGSTGTDNDTLDLRGYTAFRNLVQTNDADGNSTSGSVDVIDAMGAVRTVTFTEIENLLLPPPEDLRDGVVDGEEFGEVMNPGYDDSNGPTNGGGDIIDGPDGLDDSIRGNGGDDTINAGAGNDTVDGGTGNDVVNGGAGDDIVDGGAGDDLVTGGIGDDTVLGGAGNDELRGNEGNDSIDGGDGDDSMGGAEGDDTLLGGAGRDTLSGGSGDDVMDGGADNDTINGNSGNDVITDLDGDNLVTSGINGSPDRGFPFLGSPDPNPVDDRDTITTGAGNDTIISRDDNDVIDAGNGNNVIDAGFDDDSITSGHGNDFIVAGEGSDTINSGGGNDTIFGGENAPLVNLIDANINPAKNDPILDNGDDLIDAGDGDDLVFGEDDNDTIFGGAGNDTLDGGIDDDVIDGGSGDDLIIGGQGADSLSGGIGNDTFAVGNFTDPIFGGTYREGVGDTIVGGEDSDGTDIDVLDLTGNVNFDIFLEDSIDPTGTSGESGRVVFFTDATKTVVQGELIFKEIEEFAGPICFTPGTLIATPRGEVPVETLREGDKVITRDNGIQEIRWVGSRTLERSDLAQNRHFRPILVKKGSLGHGLPERDMVVSPQHRLLVANETTELYFNETEVLVPAKHLVNKWGISQLETLRTTYVHFMCDRHEVVLSNGSWTESFQPGMASMTTLGEDVRGEILALFPELATHEGMDSYVAARRSLKAHESKLLQL